MSLSRLGVNTLSRKIAGLSSLPQQRRLPLGYIDPDIAMSLVAVSPDLLERAKILLITRLSQYVGPRVPRRQPSKPVCTHIAMSKLYGFEERCFQCYRIPSIGFIYVCEQDQVYGEIPQIPQALKRLSKGDKRTLADLQSLGFDNSIMRAAESGFYTAAQLETLISQKLHVRSVIEITKEKDKQSETSVKSDEDGKPPYGDTIKPRSKHKHDFSDSSKPCDYKICHKCRPFSRDRSFISLEAVFNGEIQPPNAWEKGFMPVADVVTVRGLGLKQPISSQQFEDAWEDMAEDHPGESATSSTNSITPSIASKQALSDIEEEDSEYLKAYELAQGRDLSEDQTTQGQSTESKGFRDSLKRSLQDMLQRNKSGPSANRLGRKAKNKTSLNPKDSLDIDLWRKMSEDLLQEASAKMLPTDDGEDLIEPSEGSTITEEEYVEIGVALTEEAIETQTPDLITTV